MKFLSLLFAVVALIMISAFNTVESKTAYKIDTYPTGTSCKLFNIRTFSQDILVK